MRTRMHTITTLTTAALLALTACGSNDSTSANTTSQPSASSASGDTNTAALDAEQITKALADAIPNAETATVYTADTDPNDLLGRPGGYTSKADFTDERAKPKLKDDAVQQGGSVEVFEDASAAEDRAKFIADTLKAAKIFGTEYHYTSGGILLRVSGALTPDQAAEYGAALKSLS